MNNNQLLDEIGKRYNRALVTGAEGLEAVKIIEAAGSSLASKSVINF